MNTLILQQRQTIFGEVFFQRKVNNLTRIVNKFQSIPFFEYDAFLLNFYHELGHIKYPNNQNLPKDYEKRELALLLRSKEKNKLKHEEISCWKYVISKIKLLIEQGFNLGQLESNQYLRTRMDYPLVSYGCSEDEVESIFDELQIN